MRTSLVLLVALATGSACRSEPRDQRPVERAVVHVTTDPALLQSLAVLATGRQPTTAELADTQRRVDGGELSLPRYIDALLGRAEFAEQVAPLVVLRHLLSQDALTTPSVLVLSHGGDKDPIYAVAPDTCDAKDAVRVHPWWNLDSEVRVCPSSYRPDVWHARGKPGDKEMSCLSPVLTYFGTGDRGGCGCGPNLFRCYTSWDQVKEVSASLRDELRRTVSHVAANDLPAETIFTSNETFRDRNAEQVRQVQIIEAQHIRDPEPLLRAVASWPVDGKWAPRADQAPGHQAGILTSAKIAFDMPDRRQRMAVIYDVLWCVEADSVGASPESLLAIKGADLELQSAGWHELAARPICTNCHARLDYGLQFFYGFPNASYQPYFMPELQQTGRGPLYAHNIDDPRGDAELNPHGFAELALAQPEFRHCMARDFVEYALGNVVTPDEIGEVEHEMRPKATTLRDVMRTSLLALVTAWPDRDHKPVEPAPSAPSAPPDTVSVTPALHKLLDAKCLDCHDATADRPDLAPAQLARKTVVGMLAEVAFGRMPKEHPLPAAEREAFLDAFIAATWTGDDATTARDFYVGRMTAAPAFRPEVIFSLVRQIAGAEKPAPAWRMMENSVRSDHQQVTPGLIGVTGLAAIEACRAAHAQTADVHRCIDEAMQPEHLAIDRR